MMSGGPSPTGPIRAGDIVGTSAEAETVDVLDATVGVFSRTDTILSV